MLLPCFGTLLFTGNRSFDNLSFSSLIFGMLYWRSIWKRIPKIIKQLGNTVYQHEHKVKIVRKTICELNSVLYIGMFDWSVKADALSWYCMLELDYLIGLTEFSVQANGKNTLHESALAFVGICWVTNSLNNLTNCLSLNIFKHFCQFIK